MRTTFKSIKQLIKSDPFEGIIFLAFLGCILAVHVIAAARIITLFS